MKTTAMIMVMCLATLVAGALVACNSKKAQCDNCADAGAPTQAVQTDTPVVDAGSNDQ